LVLLGLNLNGKYKYVEINSSAVFERKSTQF